MPKITLTLIRGTASCMVPIEDIFGDFAIVPHHSGDGWGITHIPTGCTALPPVIIIHKRDARKLAEEYASLSRELIDRARMGDNAAIREINERIRIPGWKIKETA